MPDPRLQAARILQDILEKKHFLGEAKAAFSDNAPQDNAFINMLVLTAMRHLVFIRKILRRFVKKKLPAKAVFGEYALILGTTESLYMNTPDYALINSWVEITKKETDKYVAGLVNAVLRKITAGKTELRQEDKGEFFPSEFFKLLAADYGSATAKQIQQAALSEPALDITTAQNPQELARKLDGTLLPNGTVRLKNDGKIENLPDYEQGSWWVQDFAASLAVKTLGKISGLKILDICAAPGGKTAQLAAKGAEVTALDISESRLEKLKENMKRLNLGCREIICADGIKYLQSLTKPVFDAVLLDAPCSATGTIRRHPELVHIKNAADIKKQCRLQKEFLSCVGKALKIGGTLIYCVCSAAKDEGERQIQDFLQTSPEFKNLPVSASELELNPTGELEEIITPEGYIRTLPSHLQNDGGCDSFFIARLQKVK